MNPIHIFCCPTLSRTLICMSSSLLLSYVTWNQLYRNVKLFSSSAKRFTITWVSKVETSIFFPFYSPVSRVALTKSYPFDLSYHLWNAALQPIFGTDLHLFQENLHRWAPNFPPALLTSLQISPSSWTPGFRQRLRQEKIAASVWGHVVLYMSPRPACSTTKLSTSDLHPPAEATSYTAQNCSGPSSDHKSLWTLPGSLVWPPLFSSISSIHRAPDPWQQGDVIFFECSGDHHANLWPSADTVHFPRTHRPRKTPIHLQNQIENLPRGFCWLPITRHLNWRGMLPSLYSCIHTILQLKPRSPHRSWWQVWVPFLSSTAAPWKCIPLVCFWG